MATTGSGVSHRLVPALVQIDDVDQHVEFTALRAAGLSVHEPVDPGQRRFVVRLGPNRLDVGHLHTSWAPTASYFRVRADESHVDDVVPVLDLTTSRQARGRTPRR